MKVRILCSTCFLVGIVLIEGVSFLSVTPRSLSGFFVEVAEAAGLAKQEGGTTKSNISAPPRTPWGTPDLQGIWDYHTLTPLQRPDELEGRESLTYEESVEFTKKRFEVLGGLDNAISGDWWDFDAELTEDRRTSVIVDPVDGKIPQLTEKARKQLEASEEANRKRPFDSWEGQRLADRCILGYTAGPPILPVYPVNNNVQLFQTQQYVALLNEMIHDVRIVPLDGRPHLDEKLLQWLGDSRGSWEGNTLVVETKNFTDKSRYWWAGHASWRVSRQTFHLVERFTRVDDDTLLYEFTVNDPETWEKPWSGIVPMKKSEHAILEYACHEGNYDLPNILRVHRALEKEAPDDVRENKLK